MGDVPAEAVMRSSEITHAAFKLYAYYCIQRVGDSAESKPSHEEINKATGIAYTYISDLKRELSDRQWLRLGRGRRVYLQVGFADKTSDNPKIEDEEKFGLSEYSDKQNLISSDNQNGSDNPKILADKTSDNPKISNPNNGKSSDNPKIPPTPPLKEELLIKPVAAAAVGLDTEVDETYLLTVEQMEAYEGLDVRGVYKRALARCRSEGDDLTKPPPLTRRRLMRWLNEELTTFRNRIANEKASNHDKIGGYR